MIKKWVIVGLVLFFTLTIGLSVYAYQVIRSPLLESQEQATSYVLEEGLLSSVTDVEFYHGTAAYIVLFGIDEDGDESIVWLNEENEAIVRKAEDGITFEQAREIAEAELPIQELRSIRLGIEVNRPIYEITYFDNEERQSYYYVTFEDGTFVKRYSIRP
ncbi:cell wall elongation regulator TseB-like domain-containing protein [Halalkalibacterium ligniniphilum]|uniref:cell wall elongation regulator TseB-like domain-containing protein n=1 Tax=Halalkalibacterium ligniniphilum TaxID=1134413 RepID=UPI000347F7B9|nr:DUF5590 domain-containing protein [Halalkalibacterium ligniniphilum]